MRLMVVVLAMMVAGVAVAQEAEQFPLTKEQFADMKPNSPDEAKFAAWVFKNAELSPPIRDAGAFGVHKEAGVVVLGGDWKDHKDKMMKPEAGNKFAAFEVTIFGVEGEHKPNPLYIKVQCSGAVYETSMMATAPAPKLGTTSVMAGESVTGWVVVEVPASATAETCKWAWDVPMKGRTKWLKITAMDKK